jgi:2-oxoglutarate ferredoxin oxidoreductase subunit gamma
VERELVMSGIGGQGIQLAATVLASAAFAEDLDVQLFGSYGGMMRGGATEAAVVFATEPLQAPPTLAAAWSVILLHHEHSAHARRCVGPGSIVLLNSSVVHGVDFGEALVVEVPATDIATEVGHAMAASLVMVGAYAVATGIVSVAALKTAAEAALPSYRSQHRAVNDRAIDAGAAAVPTPQCAAWPAGARA